jgi:nitroreductase
MSNKSSKTTLAASSPRSRELTVREAADQRRSIRKYTDDPVPEADLREILRIASLAPSAWNLQPWRAVVVRDPVLKAQLMAAANNQAQVGAAPAVVVLFSDVEDAFALRETSGEPPSKTLAAMTPEKRSSLAHSLTYIALGYLLLAAESLGYVTSPMLGFKADEVKTLLDLPPHATVAALVAIGIAAESGKPSKRHSVDRIVQFR